MTKQKRSALTRKANRELDELVLARIHNVAAKSGRIFSRSSRALAGGSRCACWSSPAIRETSMCALGALSLSVGGYQGESDDHSFARCVGALGTSDAYVKGINDGFEGHAVKHGPGPTNLEIGKHGTRSEYARGWAIGAAVAAEYIGDAS